MTKGKKTLLVVAVIILMVIALVWLLGVKATISFNEPISIEQLKEIEGENNLFIDGVIVKYNQTDNDGIATGLIDFAGYEMLEEEIKLHVSEDNYDYQGIMGLYVQGKRGDVKKLEKSDIVYVVEKRFNMPLSKTSFDGYPDGVFREWQKQE